MKKIYTALLMLLTTASVFAQVPQKISYQSVIRNASNVLITNAVVGIKVSLLQGGSNGVSVYSETHTPTTNANGLVSLAIGTGTVVQGVFANIDWSTGSYFVRTEIDPTGGVNYTLIGTSELLSVPFALHAKTASNSGSGGGMAPGTKAGEMLYWNGTAWVSVAPGTRGQNLTLCEGGVPTWGPCPIGLPVVQTLTVSLANGELTSNINVVSDGGANITYRGVLFGNNPDLTVFNPAIHQAADAVSGNGSGLGAYTKTGTIFYDYSIPTAGSIFYARSYAINAAGVAYGDALPYTIPAHPNVGDFYQGGYVAYLDVNLEHGLIVAPSDQSTGTYWSVGPNNNNSANGTAIGTGESNTAFIMFNQGNSALAAKLCYDLELGGYSDWFLPSDEELFTAHKLLPPPTYTNVTPCTEPMSYWTSSEKGTDEVGSIAVSYSSVYDIYAYYKCSKDRIKRVRAMRKF